MLLGSTGYLSGSKPRAAVGSVPLAAGGGGGSGSLAPLVYDGMLVPTMDKDASRFLYITNDRITGSIEGGLRQFATADLFVGTEPVSANVLGEAPASATRSLTSYWTWERLSS